MRAQEGSGNPDEEEEFIKAVDRLIELCNGGTLPMRWQRAHFKRLAANIEPVEDAA